MTQTTVRTITSGTTLVTTRFPRPREAVQVSPAPPPAEDDGSHLVPVLEPMLSRRPVVSRRAVALDAVLALSLAAAAAALGLLPLAVSVTAATSWLVVLLSDGHHRRCTVGERRLVRSGQVLGTGVRVAVVALALSPWITGVDLVALAELVAVLSVASATVPLVGGRRRRPRLVLAGRPRDVREAMVELQAVDTHEVVAACLTRTSRVSFGDLPTYVGFGTSSAVAHHHGADALVVLPGARLTPLQVRRLHWSLARVGTELYLGTGLLDVEPQRTRVVSTGGIDILHVTSPVLAGPRRILKDVVERSTALLAFVATLPILAALCLAIRLETPGPALFRQERIGRDGVPFTMLKLRSMGVAAEDEKSGLAEANDGDGVLFKIQLDPRVTPLGRRLRRYSLDELPQLWNVVRGDMSLVGPRPALPCEVARYDIDPRRRLVVKPGVTGLWQVSGRSDLSWAESVRLDLKYVDNWSLRLDLTILVRTVQAVLGHRGAY